MKICGVCDWAKGYYPLKLSKGIRKCKPVSNRLVTMFLIDRNSSTTVLQLQSNHGYSAVACDQTIEQTANRDSKQKVV